MPFSKAILRSLAEAAAQLPTAAGVLLLLSTVSSAATTGTQDGLLTLDAQCGNGTAYVLHSFAREIAPSMPGWGLTPDQLSVYEQRAEFGPRKTAYEMVRAYGYLTQTIGLNDAQAIEMLSFTHTCTFAVTTVGESIVGVYNGVEVALPKDRCRGLPGSFLDKPHKNPIIETRYCLCLVRLTAFARQFADALADYVVENRAQPEYPEQLLLPIVPGTDDGDLMEGLWVGREFYYLGVPGITYSQGTLFASMTFPIPVDD